MTIRTSEFIYRELEGIFINNLNFLETSHHMKKYLLRHFSKCN